MKKFYLHKTDSNNYKNISVLKEGNPSSNIQSYWQDACSIYVYDLKQKNAFYKFLHPLQYKIEARKLLIIENIYAHILFREGLI